MDEEGHLAFDLDGRIMPGECRCRHPESHFVERITHVAIEEAKEPQRFELPALAWKPDPDAPPQPAGEPVPDVAEQVYRIAGVDYGWKELQDWFDEHRPLGMCNACMTNLRGAEQASTEPVTVHAAATLVAVVQNITMNIPGVGQQSVPTVLSLPSCLYCPQIIKHSKLSGPTGGNLTY